MNKLLKVLYHTHMTFMMNNIKHIKPKSVIDSEVISPFIIGGKRKNLVKRTIKKNIVLENFKNVLLISVYYYMLMNVIY